LEDIGPAPKGAEIVTTASRERLITFLLRAGLLAAALAIIAGIFGMHLMTGVHGMTVHAMPGAGDRHTAAQMSADAAGHSGHGTEPVLAGMAPAEAATGSTSSCPAGSCPEMSAGGAACVLAPGNTSLTAPLPGTAPCALPDLAGTAVAGSNYFYSPDSPSPGDLCISRT
jgi:hypothetical protein